MDAPPSNPSVTHLEELLVYHLKISSRHTQLNNSMNPEEFVVPPKPPAKLTMNMIPPPLRCG